jgi:hypothetical protein
MDHISDLCRSVLPGHCNKEADFVSSTHFYLMIQAIIMLNFLSWDLLVGIPDH